MYFTPQQLSGGPKYNFKTRVGNWQEDWEAHETKLKNYMSTKEKNQLVINLTQQKFAKSFQRVPHTYREDGSLHFGDSVMLKNTFTDANLVFDMSDRITTHDEAYAVTASDKVNACARSILNIEKVNLNDGAPDDRIRYGQEIRLAANAHILHKPLYLHSQQISPLCYARFSRFQEVCLHTKSVYNTVWKIIPAVGDRKEFLGRPVSANESIMLEHAATSQCLSNDKITYRNDFGNELEVSAMSQSTKNKSQILANENTGNKVRENTHKSVSNQNHWVFQLATEPSAEEPIAEVPRYTGEQMVQEIKDKLKSRGAMMIRGIGRVFRILDDNRNRQIDAQELMWGLKDFDIHLNEDQIKALIKEFDRDNSGSVNFDEFLRALRGELNDFRRGYIRQAYDKLDVNKDGLVTLDDIAKLYDVSQHPDVKDGKKTPEQAYREFMSMWDTQVADGIITFDEFCEYFKDVSASVDTDEYFAVMMTNAWKL